MIHQGPFCYRNLCCNLQGLTGSQHSGKQNTHRAGGMSDMPLFTGGWTPHAASRLSSCMCLPVSAYHLSPLCGTRHGTQCSIQQGASTAFLNSRTNKASKKPENYITYHNSAHVSPLHVMGTIYRTHSLKAMWTLIIRHLQGYGNTVSLSYPDTWVRKPDCFYLPYKTLKERSLSADIPELEWRDWKPVASLPLRGASQAKEDE